MKKKYHDIDALLSKDTKAEDDNNEGKQETEERVRRPSPAISAITGRDRPVSAIASAKAKAKADVEEAKRNFEQEKESLLSELNKAKSESSPPIALVMPVTKQEVMFVVDRVDPDLIDVSPENERKQEFLDEIALNDILPSIRQEGQQQPGTLRPRPNGRFELIEGSRRLAAVKILGLPYLAKIGDVPDADIRSLTRIENKYKEVSPYEKGLAYKRLVETGEYASWNRLASVLNISTTHIQRFKACMEMDEIFARLFASPSDMPLNYGETIASLIKKDKQRLYEKAKELLLMRNDTAQGYDEKPDANKILRELKSSVRTPPSKPTTRAPVVYENTQKSYRLKQSVARKTGSTKFELDGIQEKDIEKIAKFIISTLQLEGKKPGK